MSDQKRYPSFIAKRVGEAEGSEAKEIRVGSAWPYDGTHHKLQIETIDGGVFHLRAHEAEEGAANPPLYRAYRVIDPSPQAPEGTKARWIEVGAVWTRRDGGDGLDLRLRTLHGALSVFLVPFEPKTENAATTEELQKGLDDEMIDPKDIPF